MPLDSARTINAFRSGFDIGDVMRQRRREEKLNRIVGNAFIPATPSRMEMQDIPNAERGNYLSPQSRREVQVPGQPSRFDYESILPELGRAGYGKEAFALEQSGADRELAGLLKRAQAASLMRDKQTDFMREAIAAGIQPGSPEFLEAWRKKNEGAGRGEYSLPVQTAEGVMSFDTRRQGRLTRPTMDGRPIVGSTSDPSLQGRISGAKEFGQTVGKEVSDIGRGTDALTSLSEARASLNDGIYSGYWGELQKAAAKATPGIDKTKAVNTETFLSHIGNVVIPRLKDFGGNDTVEELKYLREVLAGSIKLEEPAIRNILDSSERKLQAKMSRLSKQAETIGLNAGGQASSPQAAPTVNSKTGKPYMAGDIITKSGKNYVIRKLSPDGNHEIEPLR